MLFVVILAAFPGVGAFITDPPTVSRATLHLAPSIIVLMVLAFCAFAERWRTAHPPPAAPAAPPTPEATTPGEPVAVAATPAAPTAGA